MIYSTSQSQYYQVGVVAYASGSTAKVITLNISNTTATSQATTDFETSGTTDGLSDAQVIPYDPNTKSFST